MQYWQIPSLGSYEPHLGCLSYAVILDEDHRLVLENISYYSEIGGFHNYLLLIRDAPIPKKRPIPILYFFSANTDTFIFILIMHIWIYLNYINLLFINIFTIYLLYSGIGWAVSQLFLNFIFG